MSKLRSNPLYNNAHGAATQTSTPPFDLEGVIMRYFPLRASFHSLQLFCNRYLNIAPKYARFEPVAPFVILGVINYGRMGTVSSSYSYTSQNEVIFGVPLNWYEVKDGRSVLKGPASVTPFIWVDEPSSLWTGREVFGWPKNMAWLTPGVDAWIKDPRSPRTLFTLSAEVFRDLFAGQRQEPEQLIEIEEEQPPALMELPPNPFNELNPLLAWPKSFLNALRMGGDLLETATRLPLRGFPEWGKAASICEMMAKAFGSFNIFRQLPPANMINLKQFRDPQAPTLAAYQALVNSQMTTTSFNRGGFLGEAGLLRGDFGGGYRIRLHRHPGWPIIESLGLEVSEESCEGGRSVAMLEPVFPFWLDVDFTYGKGEVLCWRTQHTHWAPPPGKGIPAVEPDSPPKPSGREVNPAAAPHCDVCNSPHAYNVAEGGAIQQVYGPFYFPNVTTRVLPLLADWETLRTFCDNYLNDGRPTKLEPETGHPLLTDEDKQSMDALAQHLFVPWGRYVYMIISSFEEVTSEVNIGWWARRRVAFSFPIRWYKRESTKKETWELKSVALVSPFMFADTAPAATTGREMQGWPVAEAEIESPPHNWLNDGGPICPEDLLTLHTNVTPALNANQKTQRGLLIEVTGRDPLEETDANGWKQVAAEWGERLVKETREKAHWSSEKDEDPDKPGWKPCHRLWWLKSLGLEILGNHASINHLSMKQFRDAEDPSRACFQAINLYPEILRRVHDLREIDRRLHVAIHRYPTQPVVKALGLHVKWTDSSQGQAVDYLQPIRPFWFRADISSDLGTDILLRSGSKTWRKGETPKLYFDFNQLKEPAPSSTSAEWFDKYPQQLQDVTTDHVQKILRNQARKILGKESWWDNRREYQKIVMKSEFSFAPQIAIESALSKRWVNFERAEQDSRDCPDSVLRKDTIGHKGVRDKFEKIHELTLSKRPSLHLPRRVTEQEENEGDHWIFLAEQQKKYKVVAKKKATAKKKTPVKKKASAKKKATAKKKAPAKKKALAKE